MKKLNWGWRIAIVYGVFALSTVAWVVFAMSTEVDLIRPDYYQYSLEQDKTSSIRANAKRLGDTVNVTLDEQTKSVRIRIPREQVTGAKGSVTFYRPSSLHQDKTYPLQLSSEGTMAIPVSTLEKGVWDVTVRWTSGQGRTYELVSRETL